MSRIVGRRNLAEVRWAHNRRAGRPIAMPDAHWMHIRRPPGSLGSRGVHHLLFRQGRGRSLTWLDDEHRHLIMPLALWDVSGQLDAAAALFREVTERPPLSPEAGP